MLAPLRSANDQRFSWLRNVFLKSFQDWLNSVQQRQGQGTYETYINYELYVILYILFLKNSSFTKAMTRIVSATLPGVETLIKNHPFYGN